MNLFYRNEEQKRKVTVLSKGYNQLHWCSDTGTKGSGGFFFQNAKRLNQKAYRDNHESIKMNRWLQRNG